MFHLLFIVPTVAIAEVQAVAAGPQLDLMGHAGSTCLLSEQNLVDFLHKAEVSVALYRSLAMMHTDIKMKFSLPSMVLSLLEVLAGGVP